MVKIQTPPGLTSISWMVFVNPFGPHQLTTCLGSVQADQTNSRGAFKMRVMNISRSAVGLFVSVLAIGLSLMEKIIQVSFQFVKVLFISIDSKDFYFFTLFHCGMQHLKGDARFVSECFKCSRHLQFVYRLYVVEYNSLRSH